MTKLISAILIALTLIQNNAPTELKPVSFLPMAFVSAPTNKPRPTKVPSSPPPCVPEPGKMCP